MNKTGASSKALREAKPGVAYFGNREQDLEDIAEQFDWVLFAINEQDLKFNKKRLEKQIAISRGLGLEVWANFWGGAGLFGGEGISEMSDLCSQSCQVQNLLQTWETFIAQAGVQVALWDEPRSSCCDVWQGINDHMARTHDLGMKNALCLPPETPWPNPLLFGDRLDIVSTDPYWCPGHVESPFSYIENWLQEIRAYATRGNFETQLWMQAFRIPEHFHRLATELFAYFSDYDIDYLGIWSYQAGVPLGCLESEKPEKLWNELVAHLERKC